MKEIKNALSESPQAIENILRILDFNHIKRDTYKKEIICGNSEKGHGNSIHIKLDETLMSSDFKYGVKGDLISFLMKKKKIELKEVMNLIKNELGIDSFCYSKKESNGLFGGAYNKIKKVNKFEMLNILSEDTLYPFSNKYNTMFLKDGISIETQIKFEIGFDIETQRITIPWRDYEGSLIGVMGRYNGECDHAYRWLPVIPFPKRDLLYGYSHNYMQLENCEVIYVGESEKSVLQWDSMDINTTLGIGRSEISAMQIKKIISLQPKKIIYCLDEGLPEEISIKNVKATQQFLKYYDIEVGYIYDEQNDILPYDSKYSPSDLCKEEFLELIEKKVKGVI
jgi:DNA primase